MTDDQATNEEPVKSAVDLKLEDLEKKITDLTAKYEAELSEAMKANKELWAQLHPVPEQPVSSTVSIPGSEQSQTIDAAEAAFYKSFGIERKE